MDLDEDDDVEDALALIGTTAMICQHGRSVFRPERAAFLPHSTQPSVCDRARA